MKFRRSLDRVLQTEVDGGIALLDHTTNTYFLLNTTGAVVWTTLEDEVTVDEICSKVASHFDVTEEHCKSDVLSLIDSMKLKGFVISSDEGSV